MHALILLLAPPLGHDRKVEVWQCVCICGNGGLAACQSLTTFELSHDPLWEATPGEAEIALKVRATWDFTTML